MILVHPYFLAQRDTDLLAEYAHLSCANICIDGSRFSPDLYKDKRVTLNRRQKNEIPKGEAFVTGTNQASWNLLTSTISHGRTIMYMVVSAIEASKMAVGYFFKIFDPGKNGVQLTDDFSMKLKNEFVSGDKKDVIFPYTPFQDDDMERPVEIHSLETYLLRNANANDKVVIIADTRHTRRWSEREVDPILCKGDLAFFCNCPVTLENLRPRANERIPGTLTGDLHSQRCAQVCFTGTEEDQAEQHDHETVDEVLEDQVMEQGGDALEEADREADLLEQIPLLGRKERLASCLRLSRRACQTVTPKLATSTGRNTCADVTCCPSFTRLYRCRQDLSMSGM